MAGIKKTFNIYLKFSETNINLIKKILVELFILFLAKRIQKDRDLVLLKHFFSTE